MWNVLGYIQTIGYINTTDNDNLIGYGETYAK